MIRTWRQLIQSTILRLFLNERNRLRVFHQRHETEIHVQLHVAVVEREPGIIRDEIDFGALAARHVDRVFADARCRLSADPC